MNLSLHECRILATSIFIVAAFMSSCNSGSSNMSNATVDFAVPNQIANEYLAITVEVTVDTVTPLASELVRGAGKANSAAADLQVIPSAAGVETGVYSMSDPRFFRLEQSEWRTAPSANAIVFVPLSATIDKLEITPLPGRQPFTSAGATFDPRQWAVLACQASTATFAECPAVIALRASGAVSVP